MFLSLPLARHSGEAASLRRQAFGLITVQSLDLITTHAGLVRTAREANPIGHGLLGHGFMALVAAKLLGTAAIIGMAWLLYRHIHQRQAVIALQVCCAIMLGVVGWNSWILLLH